MLNPPSCQVEATDASSEGMQRLQNSILHGRSCFHDLGQGHVKFNEKRSDPSSLQAHHNSSHRHKQCEEETKLLECSTAQVQKALPRYLRMRAAGP